MNVENRGLKNKKIKVEKLFLIFAIIFGVTMTVAQPVFSVPDENTHFINAYSVFHNDSKDESFGRYWKYSQDVTTATRNNTYIQKFFVEQGDFRENKLALHFNLTKIQYLPQAIGILLGELIYPSKGVLVTAGRLFNLFLYIFMIYFSIKRAKAIKWGMLLVALFPISVQQAASLSYDVLFFGAVFVTMSVLTNLWTRKEKLDIKWWIYIFLNIFLLYISKNSVYLLGLFFVTLPPFLLGKNKLSDALERFWILCKKFWYVVLLLVVIAIIFYLRYAFRNYGGLLNGMQILVNTFLRPDFNPTLDTIMTIGIIGDFGQLNHWLPAWWVIINFIVLILVGINDGKKIDYNVRTVFSSGLIYFLNILMVAVLMYTSWTIGKLSLTNIVYSSGSQGRYYTPFLIVLAPVCAYIGRFIKVSMSERIEKNVVVGLVSINLISFLLLTLAFYYNVDGGQHILFDLLGR